MIKYLLFFFFVFLSRETFALCSDQPTNEVDWTNCNFVESLDLSGVTLANAEMPGVNLTYANIEKSQINNANMAFGNFIFTNFNNSNLFASNLQYANCNNANFDNSNLAKVSFEGANLFSSSFKGANLFEVDSLLITSGIHQSSFDSKKPRWETNINQVKNLDILPTFLCSKFQI